MVNISQNVCRESIHVFNDLCCDAIQEKNLNWIQYFSPHLNSSHEMPSGGSVCRKFVVAFIVIALLAPIISRQIISPVLFAFLTRSAKGRFLFQDGHLKNPQVQREFQFICQLNKVRPNKNSSLQQKSLRDSMSYSANFMKHFSFSSFSPIIIQSMTCFQTILSNF